MNYKIIKKLEKQLNYNYETNSVSYKEVPYFIIYRKGKLLNIYNHPITEGDHIIKFKTIDSAQSYCSYWDQIHYPKDKTLNIDYDDEILK